jgi:excisionase family DNA binding protein
MSVVAMSNNDSSVLMTVAEVAALLRTSPAAIYQMVNRRQIGGVVRLGRRVLFSRTELLAWLDTKRVPPAKDYGR